MKATFVMCMAVVLMALDICAEEIIFVYETWPPYEYEDEHGKTIGKDTAIIREVCKRLGMTPVFRRLPWPRALQEAKNGTAHGIYSLFWTEERAKFLYYPSENTSVQRTVLFARKDSGVQITQLEDLHGKTVGAVRGTSYGPAFDQYTGSVKEWSVDNTMLLKKLARKRVEVVAIPEEVGKYLIAKLGWQGRFVIMDFPLSDPLPLYVAFSKALRARGKSLADQFAMILRHLKHEGFIQRVYATAD